MSAHGAITRGVWVLLAFSVLLAGGAFALPRLWPIPSGADAGLIALRDEHHALVVNDDATLARLRTQAKTQPPAVWSEEAFVERIGTGWRVAWQPPVGSTRPAVLTHYGPRLHEWPDYLNFVRTWAATPGIVLDSLEVTAHGAAQTREIASVIVALRVVLSGAPMGDGERAAPSRGPLPVAAAEGAATTRKIGPGPSLRRPAASAEPPAPGQDSAPVRPDPPGARAAVLSPIPADPKPNNP